MSDSNCAKELANDVFNTFCARVLKFYGLNSAFATQIFLSALHRIKRARRVLELKV